MNTDSTNPSAQPIRHSTPRDPHPSLKSYGILRRVGKASLKRVLVRIHRVVVGRKRVAVLLDEDAASGTQQILQRAAEHFSGIGDITFQVITCKPGLFTTAFVCSRFAGLLVSGHHRWTTGLFPKLLPIYDVDPQREANALWRWHDIISALQPLTPFRIQQARERLTHTVSQLSACGLEKCYIFGTGPSLEKARTLDFTDGYRIVCNTICRDRELFGHLKPHILVAGDAQYHFSDTKHAQAFLRDVERRMEESEFVFCYPADFDPFVKRRFEMFENRLIPIPVGNTFNLTADMTREFSLPNTGNVLGLLLLPIACQISRDVQLLGFDGRRQSDDKFWKNSSNHSYPDLIEEMMSEYPAFYNHFVPKTNPYNYVNSVFGDYLDQAMSKAEREGWRFSLLSPSTSPALAKRPLRV